MIRAYFQWVTFMPVSQQDIDALNTAISGGEKQVVLDGQSVTYRSMDELIKARNDLQEQLNLQKPVKRTKRFYNYYAGRDY
ncbi:head-tail adaptor [Curvibacter phage PCA1]|nr:head-tail adaptor [Curvibacter phage PCA1]